MNIIEVVVESVIIVNITPQVIITTKWNAHIFAGAYADAVWLALPKYH